MLGTAQEKMQDAEGKICEIEQKIPLGTHVIENVC
jgi:hypothetical protein